MEKGYRLLGASIFVGGILMLIATVLHPPLVNPYDGQTAFHGYSHSRLWMWDHILMLLATFLWLLGLAGSRFYYSAGKLSSKLGSYSFIVSISIWIIILSAELTILPIIGEEVIQNDGSTLFKVWESVFSFLLLAGYYAVACGWIGVFLYGWGMRRVKMEHFSSLFNNSALYSGLIGLIGIIITCISFPIGYIVIPLTSGPPFIWTMLLAVKMLRKQVE